MAENNKISINIEAEDKASSVIKQLIGVMRELTQQVSSLNAILREVQKNLGNLQVSAQVTPKVEVKEESVKQARETTRRAKEKVKQEIAEELAQTEVKLPLQVQAEVSIKEFQEGVGKKIVGVGERIKYKGDWITPFNLRDYQKIATTSIKQVTESLREISSPELQTQIFENLFGSLANYRRLTEKLRPQYQRIFQEFQRQVKDLRLPYEEAIQYFTKPNVIYNPWEITYRLAKSEIEKKRWERLFALSQTGAHLQGIIKGEEEIESLKDIPKLLKPITSSLPYLLPAKALKEKIAQFSPIKPEFFINKEEIGRAYSSIEEDAKNYIEKLVEAEIQTEKLKATTQELQATIQQTFQPQFQISLLPLQGDLPTKVNILSTNLNTLKDNLEKIGQEGYTDEIIKKISEFGSQVEGFGVSLKSIPGYTTTWSKSFVTLGKSIWQNALSLKQDIELTGEYKDAVESLKGTLGTLEEVLNNLTAQIAKEHQRAIRQQIYDWRNLGRSLWHVGTTAIAVGGAVSGFFGKALQALGRYGLESKWYAMRMGMSTQEIQGLQVVAQYTNTTLQQLATAVAVLSRKIFDAGANSGVATRAIKVLGVQLFEANGHFRDTPSLLAEIMLKLQRIPNALERNAVMTKIFGRENTRQVLFLLQTYKQFEETFEKGIRFGVIFSEEDQKNAENLQKTLIDLSLAFKGLLYTIALSVAPYFMAFAQVVIRVITGFRDLIKSLGPVGGLLSSLVGGFGLLAVVLGLLALTIGKLIMGIPVFIAQMKMLEASALPLLPLLGKIGLALGAIVAVLSLFFAFRDPFKNIKDYAKQFQTDFMNIFKSLSEDAYGAGYDFAEAYREGLSQGSYRLKQYAWQLAEELFELFGGGHSPAKVGPLSNLEYWGADFVKSYVEGMGNEIALQKSKITQLLGQLLDAILTNITENWKASWAGFTSWIKERTYELGYDIGTLLANALWGKGTTSLWGVLKDYIVDIIRQAGNTITNYFKGLSSSIQYNITNFFNNLESEIIKATGVQGNTFWGGLIQGFVGNVFDPLVSLINSRVSTVFNWITVKIDGLTGGLLSLINSFTSLTDEARIGLTQWLSSQISQSRQIQFLQEIFGVERHAEGTITHSPHVAVIGEEGPEAIIPLSPKRRSRGIRLWLEAGRRLGIPFFAEGGITGGGAPSNLEEWVNALGSILMVGFENFRTGIVEAIARWEDVSKDISKTLRITRDFEYQSSQKTLEKLEYIRLNTGNLVKAVEKTIGYLSFISIATQNTQKEISQPLEVAKVEQTVITNDENLRVMLGALATNKDIANLVKIVSKGNYTAEDIMRLNFAGIIRAVEKLPISPSIINQLKTLQSLKIQFEEVQEQLANLTNFWKSINTGKANIEEIRKSLEAKLKESPKETLMKYGITEKTWKEFVNRLKDIDRDLYFHLNTYTYGQLLSVLPNNEFTRKALVQALTNQDFIYQKWGNYLISIRNEIGQSIMAQSNVLQDVADLYKQSRSIEQAGVKAPSPPKYSIDLYNLPQGTQIISEFLEDVSSLVKVPTTALSMQKAPQILEWIKKEGQAQYNLEKLWNSSEKLAEQYNQIQEQYAQGQLTYAEYLQKLKLLTKGIGDQLKTLDSAQTAYKNQLTQLQEWRSKLSTFIQVLESGQLPQISTLTPEQQQYLSGLLGENYGVLTGKTEPSKEVRDQVIAILRNELSNSDALIDILMKLLSKTDNQVEVLKGIQDNTKEAIEKEKREAKSTLYEGLATFIQGGIEEGFGIIANYLKEAFIKGLADSMAKNKGFEMMSNALYSLRQVLLNPKALNLDALKNFGREMLWGFVYLNERFNQALGKFLDASLGVYKELTEIPVIGELINKMESGFLKWISGTGKLGQTIGNLASVLVPTRWVKAIADILQTPAEVLQKDFPAFLKSFFSTTSKQLEFGSLFEESPETRDFFTKLKEIYNNIVPPIVNAFKTNMEAFWKNNSWLQKAWEKVRPMGGAVMDLLRGLLGGPIGNIIASLGLDALFAVLQDFMGIFQDLYDGFLKDFVRMLKTVLKPIIMPLLAHFATILKILLQLLKPFIPLFELFAEIIGIMIKLGTTVLVAVFNVLKPIIYVFGKVVAGVIWAIGKAIDTILGWATDFGRQMMARADEMNKALDEMMNEEFKPTTEQEVEQESRKKDQPISIANLTGTALDEFKKLLSPLTALTRLDSYFQDMLNYLKTIAEALAGVPKMQHGGIITRPTLAWVGEAGAEAVIPLNRGFPVASQGVVIHNLNVYVDQIADAEDIEALTDAVLKRAGIEVRRYSYRRGR